MSAEHRREDNAEDPLITRKDLASWWKVPREGKIPTPVND